MSICIAHYAKTPLMRSNTRTVYLQASPTIPQRPLPSGQHFSTRNGSFSESINSVRNQNHTNSTQLLFDP